MNNSGGHQPGDMGYMAISVKTNGQKSVEKRKTDTNWVARGSLELIPAPLEPEFCNLSFLFFEIESKYYQKRLIFNFCFHDIGQ